MFQRDYFMGMIQDMTAALAQVLDYERKEKRKRHFLSLMSFLISTFDLVVI